MTVTTVATATFLSDCTIFLRDDILNNVTDPISSIRPTGENFVMTSYPRRPVHYPLITIQNINIVETASLGFRTPHHLIELPLEIRIWARNVKERDELSQDALNRLRNIQFTATGTVFANLFNFSVNSAVNVDEEGEAGIKSKVIEVQYSFIWGA